MKLPFNFIARVEMKKMHTIGYEKLSIGEFIDILNAHKITTLIDVRQLPLSRKKGFSKNALKDALKDVGISYIHQRELGAPKEIRNSLRQNGDWQEYCEGYENVLAENNNVMKEIAKLSSKENTTLMCFERDYETCHRSLISTKMIQLNLIKDVKHLHPQTEKVVVEA